jgi:acetyl-CoA carboxylase biotin carboxyl carrier protein
MNIKEIREIVDLITEKGIAEFELERSGFRLRINRRSAPSAAEPVYLQASPMMASMPSGVPIPGASPIAPPASGGGARSTLPTPPPSMGAAGSGAALSDEVHTVKSPMVGTFYSAPAVGAPPFVEPGVRVRVGQVLCIIEAMKLMNEIETEVEGEVIKCHVENGQPVEFGQPLFEIRPVASAKKR